LVSKQFLAAMSLCRQPFDAMYWRPFAASVICGNI
jgi:hypothetical protein